VGLEVKAISNLCRDPRQGSLAAKGCRLRSSSRFFDRRRRSFVPLVLSDQSTGYQISRLSQIRSHSSGERSDRTAGAQLQTTIETDRVSALDLHITWDEHHHRLRETSNDSSPTYICATKNAMKLSGNVQVPP